MEPSSPPVIVGTSRNNEQGDTSRNSENVSTVVDNPVQIPQSSNSTVHVCSNCNKAPCVIANAYCPPRISPANGTHLEAGKSIYPQLV